MKLREILFEPCWDAPGVRGWIGEGYWFHPLASSWFDLSGSTRVAKTTTLHRNKGHMKLWGRRLRYAPINPFPRAVWCDWSRNIALNAIGLSGPGLEELLKLGLLTQSTEPFMISLMPIEKTPEKRIEEFTNMCRLLWKAGHSNAPYGIHLNISCPSTGLNAAELHVDECLEMLNIAGALETPLLVKVNVLASIKSVQRIAEHENCDAICISNTIPFGMVPELVPWKDLFPSGSPLAKRGCPPGGLSGTILLPIVIDWVRRARESGITVPFNVGGGITHPDDVDRLVNEAGLVRGRDSIFIGSIAMLRPWNIKGVIKRAHELLG